MDFLSPQTSLRTAFYLNCVHKHHICGLGSIFHLPRPHVSIIIYTPQKITSAFDTIIAEVVRVIIFAVSGFPSHSTLKSYPHTPSHNAHTSEQFPSPQLVVCGLFYEHPNP